MWLPSPWLQKIADSKARLQVKTQDLADEAELVFGEEVRITTEGQRHLGAVIGSQEYTKTNNVLEKFRDGGKASSCWLRS